MKRIEAVMKENGKTVTPAASPMLKSSNKTTASTNFVDSTQPVNLSNQKNINRIDRGFTERFNKD